MTMDELQDLETRLDTLAYAYQRAEQHLRSSLATQGKGPAARRFAERRRRISRQLDAISRQIRSLA